MRRMLWHDEVECVVSSLLCPPGILNVCSADQPSLNLTNETIVILSVKPFARKTFYHHVEDELGNPFTAEASLIWRGDYEDAADSAKKISSTKILAKGKKLGFCKYRI